MDQTLYQNNSNVPMNQFNNQIANQMPSEQSPITNQLPSSQAPITNMMPYCAVYPEIFYRVNPFIMNVCDQMDACYYMIPTQEMMERMSDGIHDDLCKMYPEMAKYDNNVIDQDAEQPVVDVINGGPFFFRPRFRRRGLLRDLISILLFSEFQRRRRRPY
ncbi:MAG: hypothetical protein PHV07_03330 [Oscillospiraceae bacterium]|nr:hypothetical protein [Oscillospiraceae bacterium]